MEWPLYSDAHGYLRRSADHRIVAVRDKYCTNEDWAVLSTGVGHPWLFWVDPDGGIHVHDESRDQERIGTISPACSNQEWDSISQGPGSEFVPSSINCPKCGSSIRLPAAAVVHFAATLTCSACGTDVNQESKIVERVKKPPSTIQ